jgi:hypothetical protein
MIRPPGGTHALIAAAPQLLRDMAASGERFYPA